MYIQTHINGYVLKTKVLTTPNDIALGMMGKKFTNEFIALLFVMNKTDNSFWMKNCIVPLDIIFIHNNKITKIHSNCLPCKKEECKFYSGTGEYIIEMPGGTCKKLRIRKGAAVEFKEN